MRSAFKCFALLLMVFAALRPQVHAAGPALDWLKLVAPATPVRGTFAYTAAADSQGNIYVGCGPNLGLVKLSPSGNSLWTFGLRNDDFSAAFWVDSLFIDASDNLTAGGILWGSAKFGAFNVNVNQNHGFYATFTANGVNTAAKIFSEIFAENHSMALSADGGFLFGGRFRNTVNYEGISLSASAGAGSEGAVFKLKADGSPIWARRLIGDSDDYVVALASTRSGDVLVTGAFMSSSIGVAGITAPSRGVKTLYLASMDASGNGKWAKSVGSELDPGGFMTVSSAVTYSDAKDAIYWAGDFAGSMNLASPALLSAGGKDIFLARLSTGGSVAWTRRIGGTADDLATCLTTDTAGNVYLGGYFSSQITIGATKFTSKGQEDLFIAKFQSDGTLVWAKQFGSAGRDRNISISFTQSGELIVVGSIGGGMSFEGTYLEGGGPTDGFIAKFKTEGQLPIFSTQPKSQAASAGASIALTAEATAGADLTYQWWFNDSKMVNQTNATLTLTNFQSSNAGRYYATANNSVGQAKSETAAISFTDASTLILTVHPSLTIFGTIGRTYLIEYASAVSGGAWTLATNIVLSTSPEVWIDPTAVNDKRMYRVLLQP